MANRRLTPEELQRANALLFDVRERLAQLSGGDVELLFAYRRKVYKELTYDERSKPMDRRRLKKVEWREQDGFCGLSRTVAEDIQRSGPHHRIGWIHRREHHVDLPGL